MSLIALLAAIVLVLINAYFVFALDHYGALHIIAAVCSVIILLVLILPYRTDRIT